MYVLFSPHGNNILDTCQDLLSSLSPTTKKVFEGGEKMPIKKLSKHCFRSVSMVLSPAKGHCRKETMYTCKHSASPLIIKRYRDMKHLYHADRFPEQGIIKPVFMYHLQ